KFGHLGHEIWAGVTALQIPTSQPTPGKSGAPAIPFERETENQPKRRGYILRRITFWLSNHSAAAIKIAEISPWEDSLNDLPLRSGP
ncbi:hypothetical protein, partial [Roseibium polysiphoniae]|uniref:hypothetical protein n=1 Tax=Roseibium polysiphoniae TaxID=2571221 RepID=UPI0032976F21